MYKLRCQQHPGMVITTVEGPITLDKNGEATISDELAEAFKNHPLFHVEPCGKKGKPADEAPDPVPDAAPAATEEESAAPAEPEAEEAPAAEEDALGEAAPDEKEEAPTTLDDLVEEPPAPKIPWGKNKAKNKKGKAAANSSDKPDDL